MGGEVGAIDQGPGQDAASESRRCREQNLIAGAAEAGADKVDGAPSLTREAGEGERGILTAAGRNSTLIRVNPSYLSAVLAEFDTIRGRNFKRL